MLTTNSIARNISSNCNSSGSVIWASAKNIKPLVDANCHTEAIEFAYHQSPIRFAPIHYRNPVSKSLSPSGQTILFGCPLELCAVGKLKKIPPVLEYLLDSVNYLGYSIPHPFPVDPRHGNRMPNLLHSTMWKHWPLMNHLEREWTGVEKTDRAIISRLAPRNLDRMSLVMVCPLQFTIQKLSDFVDILYGPSKTSMDRP